MKNTMVRLISTTISFLREVKMELKKTSFPSKELTIKNTIIVIVFSIAIAVFLGGLDMIFSYLLNTYIIA